MFSKEIAGGSEFLDNYYGNKSWVMELDLGELDLKSGCNCVLGQLQGDYDTMLDILDLEESDAVRLGFCIEMQLTTEEFEEKYGKSYSTDVWGTLTEEWRTFVKDRLDLGIEL